MNLPGLKNASLTPFDDSTANLGAVNVQEAIESVEALATATPPSHSIFLDGTGGDDSNDGFTAPVQTANRLIEIINFYQWFDPSLNVSLINVTSPLPLRGIVATGVDEIVISSNATPFNTFLVINECNIPITIQSFVVQGIGSFILQNLKSVTFGSGMSFQSGFINPVINCSNVERVALNNPNLTGSFNNTFLRVSDALNVFFSSGVFNSVSLTTLIQLTRVQSLTLDNGSGAITGSLLDASLSPYITIVEQSWTTTGSVPDTLPIVYSLNNEDYVNTVSGLVATNKQDAIDELVQIVDRVPPATTVLFDGAGGDDSNDGFTAPVRTESRLVSILNFYDWNVNAVTVNISNIPAIFELKGIFPKGIQSLILSNQTNPVTTFFNVNECQVRLVLDNFSFENNSLFFGTSNHALEINSNCVFTALTSNFMFFLSELHYLEVNAPTLVGTFAATHNFIQGEKIHNVIFDPGTFNSVVLNNLLSLSRTRALNLQPGGSAITGRVLALGDSPFINIQGNWSVTGTIPDEFPLSYVNNSKLFPSKEAYFDVSRNQNLGPTAAQDLRRAGNVPTNLSPYYPPFDSIITEVTLSQENLTDWDLEIYKNGVLETTVNKNNGASVFTSSLAINVVSTDAIRLRYAGGAATTNRPTATITLRED